MHDLKLELEIKQLIIDSLMLEDMTANDINTNEALFTEGLGLDSIDALELGVALQKKYGIQITANSTDTQKHFANVMSLIQLVSEKRTK